MLVNRDPGQKVQRADLQSATLPTRSSLQRVAHDTASAAPRPDIPARQHRRRDRACCGPDARRRAAAASAAAKFLADNGKKSDVVTTASGLQYKVLAAGSGASPKPNDEVTVNYRGTLING